MAQPFLRWAGGKRWLAPKLGPIIKEKLEGRFFEPFLGGAALFFSVAPKRAVLSDINEELINTYQTAEDCPYEIIQSLKKLRVCSATYERIRYSNPQDRIERAVRFIFLNRTCYGGLHRCNKNGDFNVPYGGGSRTPKLLWEKGVLKVASEVLREAKIRYYVSDFEDVIEEAKSGDIIYCDPTYATTERAQFDRYNGNIFAWEDQKRLAKACHRAFQRDVLVIVSNAYCRDIRKLYPSAYAICLERSKGIGNRARNGNTGFEYLIILDPKHQRKHWKHIGDIERVTNRHRA